MRRLPLLGAAALSLLLLSCAPAQVSGFPFAGPGGGPVALRQTAGFPEGEEGSFSVSASINRFILAEALRLATEASLELSFFVPAGRGAAATLSLSAREDGKEPFLLRRASLAPGRFRYLLRLPAGSLLASLSVTAEEEPAPGSGGSSAEAAGKASAGAAPPPLFRLESLAFTAGFAGFQRLAEGVRISEGVSVFREGGLERCRIASPFEALGTGAELQPALVIEYGPGSARLEVAVAGKRQFSFRARPAGGRLILPAPLFPGRPGQLEVSATSLAAAYAAAIPRRDAELLDLGVLLRLPPGPSLAAGLDFDLYRWELLPSVLVLDFRDYAAQDRSLKRLAFFVEKLGFRGRLATDAEIAGLHGWNAHDYRAEDLAAFFGKAAAESFPLGAAELGLRDLLLERGIIKGGAGGYAAGEGAIVSIARESSDALRATFITHESLHALYFVDPGWRETAAASWRSLSEGEKWFWRLYFGWANYDTANDYLMANEYMAYLLQQAPERVTDYFTRNLPSRLLEKHGELAPRLAAYMAEYGANFERRARELGARLSAAYGLAAGKSWLLD